MRAPFTRRCKTHTQKEVTSSISETGHESIWCGEGHRVKEWYVMDADDVVLAIGYRDEAPKILDAEMLEKLNVDTKFLVVPPAPEDTCKRGHNDWYLNPDERYRCRSCKKEYYQRNKEKILNREAGRRRAAGVKRRRKERV